MDRSDTESSVEKEDNSSGGDSVPATPESTQHEYPYKPLNLPYETRIVTIQPAESFHDPIICSLSHIPLPTKTKSPNDTSPSTPNTDSVENGLQQLQIDTTPVAGEDTSLQPDQHENSTYQALSYCWTQSVANSTKGKPPPAPETVTMTCSLSYDDDGNELVEHGTILFKDELDHPIYHNGYIDCGGPLPARPIICDGVTLTIGGELHRALLRMRPYYPPPRPIPTDSYESLSCGPCRESVRNAIVAAYICEEEQRRKQVKPLRLWIDALCINQSDSVEKNTHVRIMSEIYRNASHVHIWLGEETGVEDRIISFLYRARDIFNAMPTTTTSSTDNNTTAPTTRKVVPDDNIQSIQEAFRADEREFGIPTPTNWDALTGLLEQRNWFSRTWIVQEAANAASASFWIGKIEIHWDLFVHVIYLLRYYGLDIIVSHCEAIKAICIMVDLRREVSGRISSSTLFGGLIQGGGEENGVTATDGCTSMSLVQLLEKLRWLKSTIASDKIYGILALTRERDSLVVDYEKGSDEVFVDFAVGHLLGSGNGGASVGSVDILSHCIMVSPYGEQVLDLPSWVPDWTRAGHAEPFSTKGLEANACGDLKTTPELSISEDRKILRIKGYLVDTIEEIETELPIPIVFKELAQEWDLYPNYPDRGQAVTDENGNPKTVEGIRTERWNAIGGKVHRNILRMAFREDDERTDEAWEALWRTYMCNRSRENKTLCGDRTCCKFREGFEVELEAKMRHVGAEVVVREKVEQRRLEGDGTVPGSEEEEKWVTEVSRAADIVRLAHNKWCENRRFVRSEKGRYGWVMNGTEMGDKVAVLKGGKCPLILREVKGEDGEDVRYRIVGDCYLHGVMEGEAVAEGSGHEEVELVII